MDGIGVPYWSCKKQAYLKIMYIFIHICIFCNIIPFFTFFNRYYLYRSTNVSMISINLFPFMNDNYYVSFQNCGQLDTMSFFNLCYLNVSMISINLFPMFMNDNYYVSFQNCGQLGTMSQHLSLSLSGSQISSTKKSGTGGNISSRSSSSRPGSARPGSAGGSRPTSNRSTRGKSPGRGELGANFRSPASNSRTAGKGGSGDKVKFVYKHGHVDFQVFFFLFFCSGIHNCLTLLLKICAYSTCMCTNICTYICMSPLMNYFVSQRSSKIQKLKFDWYLSSHHHHQIIIFKCDIIKRPDYNWSFQSSNDTLL